jgi:arsenate reductase-like glutaredoxin family protein
MPDIRVFGTDDSPGTRAALRFFRERRIVVRYLDVRRQPFPADELRRFVDRLGPEAVVASGSGSGREGGQDAATRSPAATVALGRADTRLLRLPLVRHGEEMTAGDAPATWKAWLARRR